MDPKEIAKEEAKLAAQIKEQQELLDAFKKVRTHLEKSGDNQISPENGGGGEAPAKTEAVRKRTRKKIKLSEANNGKAVGKAASVREAVQSLKDKFTVIDVHDHLAERGIDFEKREISFVLSRFLRNGEIFRLEKGLGRRPSLYTTIPITDSVTEGSSMERASTTASEG